MENNTNIFESLLESAADYGKTSYNLVRLKALDKTADVVSSMIPHFLVFVILASFLLFISLASALWLGEIMGKIYFGFFVVAGFYGIAGLIFYFLLFKRLKRFVSDYTIRQALK
jgi:hypothetical protein